MTDFARAHTFEAASIRLCTSECSVRGRGLLRWDPASGFALDVVVQERAMPVPVDSVNIPAVRIPVVNMGRVDFGHGAWALIPVRNLKQDPDFLGGNVVGFRAGAALFRRRHGQGLGGGRWRGDATLRALPGTILPDLVTEVVTIAGKRLRDGGRRAGLDIDLEDMSFGAEFREPDRLKAWWSLDPARWPKGSEWQVGDFVGYALGLLLGQRMRLLRRRAVRGHIEYEEVRRVNRAAEDLRFQTLFDWPPQFDKEHFVALLRMFSRNGREAFIARCVFDQLADATQQRTWQARELLTATILEAFMRNVCGKPFVPGPTWDFRQPLMHYCRTHLGDAWEPFAERAHEIWRRLRHRNAHPDWSLEKGGSDGRKAVEQATDDLIFLSWFYGYLILSLAGLGNLKPRFPLPHKEWPPALRISFGNEQGKGA